MSVLRTIRPAKALLAEDSAEDVIMLEAIMESERFYFDFTVVIDGKEALEYLGQKNRYKDISKPDIVFLDLNLPEKNGIKVLDYIRKTPSLKNLTTCILSTSDDQETIELAKEAGCDYYFVKPLRYEDLEQALIKLKKFTFRFDGTKRVLYISRDASDE